MQNKIKPFAPFGAALHHLRLDMPNIKSAIYLFCGKDSYQEAKKMCQNGYLALSLPYPKKIEDFAWPIKGLNLIVYDTGSMSALHLKRICYEVLQEGAKVVGLYCEKKMTIDIYQLKKELQHGKGEK